jgi:transposase-like protein
MAGKKPAKRNVSNNIKEEKKILPGKIVKVMGMANVGFECPACQRKLRKGIMYEHTDNKLYCSRKCIPAPVAVI